MIRLFLRFLSGYVKINIAGFSPERFLNMCSYKGICVWGLMPSPNGYELFLSVRDFRKIRSAARKTHTRIELKEKYGAPFIFVRCKKRKLFFFGLLVCIILLKVYSLFIWDINFDGNEKWTDETLAEFLQAQGVEAGMPKNKISCPAIVKAIRKEYNDIVWVSASIDGSRLKIQVKENDDTYRKEDTDVITDHQATDLIAAADGVITEIVTRSGVPQVHAGDQVKKGDILVLGRVEVLDDSGQVTGYQYRKSDADIFADTSIPYTDTVEKVYEEKVFNGKKKLSFFLKLQDWTISAGSLRNKYEHSELFSFERQIKLGENFYLPVRWGYQAVRSYDLQKKKRTEEEIREYLSLNFKLFCEDLEEKGVQIKENSVKIQLCEDSAEASGTVYVNRRIAEEADTEILTIEREEKHESDGTYD